MLFWAAGPKVPVSPAHFCCAGQSASVVHGDKDPAATQNQKEVDRMKTIQNWLTFGATVAFTMALSIGTAHATDELLTGKKLLIKNNPGGNKLVFLSKDPSITIGAAGSTSDPQCAATGGGGGRVHVQGTSGNFVISLPCAGWSSSGSLYKYKDSSQATCTVVQAKTGKKVKAICKGAQVNYTLGTAQADVAVTVTTGSGGSPSGLRYCTDFSAGTGAQVVKDGSDGKSYHAKGSAAPASCVASPSGAFLDD